MKIGIMMRHSWERGGINVYTRNIVRQFLAQSNGHTFQLFYAAPVIYGQYRNETGAEEILIPSNNRFWWDQVLILPFINGKVDVVFNPKLSIPLRSRCPAVFTMHGLEQFAARRFFKTWDRLYYSLAMPLYCRKAKGILVMTETGRRDLQRYLKVPTEKIRVIPESYDETCAVIDNRERLEQVREKYRLPERFIYFIGGITPLKNIPTLLKAYAELKRQGIRHKLVLAGFKRWAFEEDLSLIRDMGLEADVLEIGFLDDQDVSAIYNLADCFVLPSHYEGFGIPILEAQASGCPVVCSSGGAMPEVAGAGALVFDPGKATELAEKIKSVLDHQALRDKLIEAGLANVKRYSWAQTAQKTLQVFEELAQREKTSPACGTNFNQSRPARVPAVAH